MNRARDQILSSSCLARNERRRGGRRYLIDLPKDRLQRNGSAHDLLEHGRSVYFFAEDHVLVPNVLLVPPSDIVVGTCYEPSDGSTKLLHHGSVVDQEPAIRPVVAAGAR